MQIRRASVEDQEWMADAITGVFASTRVASRGRLHHDAHLLDGFVVETDGRPIGCALWHEVDGDAELVVLLSIYRGVGAGTELLDAVVNYAREAGWHRLWLITTNDNVDAIRLYQREGWDWVGFHRDSVDRSLKPEIPDHGAHGIPIRHEIEFEYPL